MTSSPTPIQKSQQGTVISVRYPIVQVDGLDNAYSGEIVHFEDGGFGQIISLGKERVSIMMFGKNIPRIGTAVESRDRSLTLQLCPDIIGKIIDPLGTHLGEEHQCEHHPENKEHRTIDVPPPHLEQRAPINQPLKTGVAIADLLLPLGKGQRELIVGDRKTGKSTFLVQTARMQIAQGSVVVYACIGKKSHEIKELLETFAHFNLSSQSCMVISTADDTPSTITLTPFTAMTVAEYLRDQGKDVVVILDDLSVHAQFYREIALLARRFPGRDSYPGDMFFVHARLLERAGNFHLQPSTSHQATTASITCLPVAVTREGELTNFIVSNLISITDGHLFFHTDLFTRGLRPAIHTGLSVTRVGKQTQTPLEREMNYALSLFLTQYEKTRGLAHFGAELTEYTRQILVKGDLLFAFFNQTKEIQLPPALSVFFAGCIYFDWFNEVPPKDLLAKRDHCIARYNSDPTVRKMIDDLLSKTSLTDLSESLTRHEKIIKTVCQL